jgi:hypothetical protein
VAGASQVAISVEEVAVLRQVSEPHQMEDKEGTDDND